ncbi:MAG: hypothetical protein OXG56_09900 [Gammaproteobacteria bacterium]|nr:hypothetical protein [Gammaproteobacteria bacterium]
MLWGLLAGPATLAYADTGLADQVEFSGRLSMDTWLYSENGAYPSQRSYAGGLTLEGTAYMEDEEGRSFTLTPFLRYGAGDPERTHADLREAYLLLYGDAGENEWELRLGVDRVFWGVVESYPLVDIVNQTDLVDHPSERTKMGQPMAHVTWSGDWGALELFGLTGHRPRTYPGRHGRLRPELIVDQDLVSYESAAKEWHLDFAGRYSGTFGPLDIGLSLFDGTSREPVLMPTPVGSSIVLAPRVLAPHYEQIRQYGLDALLTAGSWLLKLEAVHRTGARNRRFDQHLNYEEEDYTAFVAGGEYTWYSLWGSNADLGLFVEWAHDGRGRWATNAFENDLFLAAHLGLNDEQSTEFIVSVVDSLDNSSRVFGAEFKRRLTDHWYLHMETSAYLEIDRTDAIDPVRRDSWTRVKLDYNF